MWPDTLLHLDPILVRFLVGSDVMLLWHHLGWIVEGHQCVTS